MNQVKTVVLWFLGATTLLGQSPDPGADSLRTLIKSTPELPVVRVELKTRGPLKLEGISAVAVDKQGNIYVLHRPAEGDPVVVFDSAGHLLRSWGKGMFKLPHGIRIDSAGNVWTVDANTSLVYKFTPEGRKILEISVGDIPDPALRFCGATDVAFSPNGRIFVSDGYCNARVIEYDQAGRKIREWGRPGTGPGEFNIVHSLAFGPQGRLYVADRENGRVQWFDTQGNFLGEFRYGGQLYNIAFGPAGEMYISTHPKGVSFGTDFNVVKIDPVSGKMLGHVEARSHLLVVAPDGTLLPATRRDDVLLIRPRQ